MESFRLGIFGGHSSATFEGGADFSEATFVRETSFSEVTFEGEASFLSAIFKEVALFYKATFKKEADFSSVTFKKEADFSSATFEEGAAFQSLQTSLQTFLSFKAAVVEKPERFRFHSTHLRPSWFVDVDAQKFGFTNVRWYGLPGGPTGRLENEIEALANRRVASPYALLSQACRRLSSNAEENREYPLANEFHYWAMDTLRKESWAEVIRIRKTWPRVERRYGRINTLRWAWRVISRRLRTSHPRGRFGLITTLYWALSGYGVRAARAFWILVGIWAFFAMLYMVAGPSEGSSELRAFSASEMRQFLDFVIRFLPFNFVFLYMHRIQAALVASEIWQSREQVVQALVYSLAALARLNRKVDEAAPTLFQFLVTAEGILGPLQIALLALAIRRKVMR